MVTLKCKRSKMRGNDGEGAVLIIVMNIKDEMRFDKFCPMSGPDPVSSVIKRNYWLDLFTNIKILKPDPNFFIVVRIEEEQQIVDSNKKLIHIYEQKIKDKIGEVWG